MMDDIVCVDIDSMYELEDGIRGFGRSIEFCDKEIKEITHELGASFKGCSRYDHVVSAISKMRRELGELEAELCAVADDIASRAEFIEEFERTPFKY